MAGRRLDAALRGVLERHGVDPALLDRHLGLAARALDRAESGLAAGALQRRWRHLIGAGPADCLAAADTALETARALLSQAQDDLAARQDLIRYARMEADPALPGLASLTLRQEADAALAILLTGYRHRVQDLGERADGVRRRLALGTSPS